MAEFKGSEGEWRKIFASGNKRAIRNSGGLIATFWQPNKYSGQDQRYEDELKETAANQLLCSKAPEMLEMLKSIVNSFETDYVLDGEIVDSPYEWLQDRYKEAKKLIKEATEL